MATVMNQHRSHHISTPRSVTQKVCIGLGIFFVVAGLAGIVMPGMLGMHLSFAHNLIHLLSGALAIWVGYSDDPKKAYNFAVAFGSVYGLLGLAGFIIGNPGYPGVGHMEADQNLLRVIPNVLEFGTADHTVHIIIAAAFLASAYAWKKQNKYVARTTGTTVTEPRTTKDVFLRDSESNLKDASLGRSDINRRADLDRRTDFENRI